MQRIAIGVDIGGTWARVGLVRGERLLVRDEFPTGEARDASHLLTLVRGRSERLARDSGAHPASIAGIGLALPGIIRLSDGAVLNAPNCPAIHGAPMATLASEILPWRCVVANDTDCAAWGEFRLGGHGFPGLVYITVSTGIGGGIVTGGRLLTGLETTVAEVGHMIVSLAGPRCACGSSGCLEAIASGTAIAAAHRKATGRRFGSERVYALAATGDPVASAIVDKAAAALASGIVGLWRLLGLPVVIGGGVTLAGDAFWKVLRRHLRPLAKSPDFAALKVLPAALGDDRGILGAALLASGRLVPDGLVGYPFPSGYADGEAKGGGRGKRA
jgi:glucokinase